MTSVGCTHCGNQSVSMSQSLDVAGNVMCFDCFETVYADGKQLQGKSVIHKLDPTICSFCEKDFGHQTLDSIGKHPACAACAVDIRNRTFPLWVKVFLAFVLLAVVFSSIWNFHYYKSWYALKESGEAFDQGDMEGAYLSAKEASLQAQDVPDLADLASYYHGIVLISKDSSRQALVEFNKSAATMGEYSQQWIALAQLHVNFEDKNYKGAIKTATNLIAMDSTGAIPWLRLASAYSCEYAKTGNDSMRTESVKNLVHARQSGFSEKSDSVYANMIDYRLATRDENIIFKDFEKKYPNGWTKNN